MLANDNKVYFIINFREINKENKFIYQNNLINTFKRKILKKNNLNIKGNKNINKEKNKTKNLLIKINN